MRLGWCGVERRGCKLPRRKGAIDLVLESAHAHPPGPVQAAVPLVVLMGPEDPDQKTLDIISVLVFDEAGKVTSMRANWSFDAMRPATADD